MFAFKNVTKNFLTVFLNINQNLAQNGQTKKHNFWHFAKHKLLNNVMLQPPTSPKKCFKLGFLKDQNIDVEQKHSLR